MRQHKVKTRALAVKIINFSAPAKAIVTRNLVEALLQLKGTIK